MSNISDKLTVLYIEDDLLDARFITDLLRDSNDPVFEIDVAKSLDEALSISCNRVYDVVLLDLTLPDSQGLVTLKQFRENFPHLPVVVLSGDDRKEVAYQAVNRGAQDYLFKNNISKEVLILTIRYAIERKQADIALEESFERFRLIVEGTSDGVWDWQDISQDEQYWSPRLKSLLGYDDGIKGSKTLMLDLVHPDDQAKVRHVMSAQLRRDQEFNIEFRVKTRHQGYRWFRAKGKLLLDNANAPVRMLGAISDVSQYKEARKEQERLQNQLQHAHKLEAIGQLAAGIAHEINTPIQFVSDHLQFLSDAQQTMQSLIKNYQQAFVSLGVENLNATLAHDIHSAERKAELNFLMDRYPDAIKAITDGLQRVTIIVKAMQRFAQADAQDRTWLDINQAIKDVVVVSGNILSGTAEVKTELSPDLPKIFASASGINQVLFAVIINACQAIEVRRKQQVQYKGLIHLQTQVQDHALCISIFDNGIGIPQDKQHRVFEPFFTTREIGQGLGQGLSQAYSIIVEQHQGDISFQSKAGRGTQFYIRLPLQSESTAAI